VYLFLIIWLLHLSTGINIYRVPLGPEKSCKVLKIEEEKSVPEKS